MGTIEMFSDFSDRTKFDGRLPSAGYLKHIFCEYSEQCREALDKEVKKKGMERCYYDASYKIPSLLSRVPADGPERIRRDPPPGLHSHRRA